MLATPKLAERSVTPSSRETEWVSLLEAVKESDLYVLQPDHNKLNQTCGPKEKIVREFVEDGTLRLKFIKSCDNDSDLITKNCPSGIHDSYTSKIAKK
ncbi:hypothetical protein ACHAWF_003198, partial [Thalassiosira exigua]